MVKPGALKWRQIWSSWCSHPGQNKPSTQEKVETGKNLDIIGGSCFTTWNLTQLYAQKVRFCSDFCQLVVFSLVNLWGHVKIAILYTTLFPLWISHPNLIKTRNPAHSYVCNSCSCYQLKSQIQQQKQKSQILHPTSHQLFWSPSFLASVGLLIFCREVMF